MIIYMKSMKNITVANIAPSPKIIDNYCQFSRYSLRLLVYFDWSRKIDYFKLIIDIILIT